MWSRKTHIAIHWGIIPPLCKVKSYILVVLVHPSTRKNLSWLIWSQNCIAYVLLYS